MSTVEIYEEILKKLEEKEFVYCLDGMSYSDDFPVIRCSYTDTRHRCYIHENDDEIHGLDILYYLSNKDDKFILSKGGRLIADENFRFATVEEIASFEAHLVLTEMK